MASNFIISRSQEHYASWFPSGGVYDQTFDGVLFELAAIDKPLAESLKGPVSIGYGSIDEVSELEFNHFLVAAQRYYQREIQEVRHRMLTRLDQLNWIKDYFAQPFMLPVGQFIAMLRADNRASESDKKPHKIDFGNGIALNAPAWIIDFILESIAIDSRLISLNRNLSDQLLKQQYSETIVMRLDLITAEEFCAILNAVIFLSRIYAVPDKGNYGYSSRFTPQIHQKIIELAKILWEHGNASDCVDILGPT